MQTPRTLGEWLQELEMDLAELSERSGLDQRVVAAIVAGRYTTSPQQRARTAAALDLTVDQIRWGQAVGVESLYGHGPQFGRSP